MFYVTSKAFVELHEVSFFQLTISFTLAALSIMFSNGGIGIYPLAWFPNRPLLRPLVSLQESKPNLSESMEKLEYEKLV